MFDIRISPGMEPHTVRDLLDSWCRDCRYDMIVVLSGHRSIAPYMDHDSTTS